MKEVWKDIKGYEGLYRVSNLGRIKSLRFGKQKILNTGKDSGGYLKVCLHKNGDRKTENIHRLIAKTFLPNTDNKDQVNHINGIRTDNRLYNLEWTKSIGNSKYAYGTGLSKCVMQYDKTGVFVAEYRSTLEAHRETGISQQSISSCCNGKRYKSAGGYSWKFKN